MKLFISILILIAAYFVAPMIIMNDEESKDTNTKNRLADISNYDSPSVNQTNQVNGHSPP